MKIDPVCGMTVNDTTKLKVGFNGVVQYFCSEACMKKFIDENNICGIDEHKSCTPSYPGAWYKDRLKLSMVGLALSVIASYFIPVLFEYRQALFMYINKIWLAVLLGFVIGGIIDHFVPREYVSKVLAQKSKSAIFYSVVLGFFMSACSHGILALSMELHKKGASNPAVIAFLLASPWANLPLTFMLIGFFGLKALYMVFCALLIAVVTGFIFRFLEDKKIVEVNNNTAFMNNGFSVKDDIKRRFKAYSFDPRVILGDVKKVFEGGLSLARMVLWWMIIGIVFASLSAAYIPQGVFQAYMGPTIAGLLVTLVVATIIEVCSEGTAPLAFEIFRQTGAFGNAFVFLMAGVVTDYTEIGLLWFNVGKRVAVWLPIITVPQVVLLGMLANYLFV